MLEHFQRTTFASDGNEGEIDGNDECMSLEKGVHTLEHDVHFKPGDFDKVVV